MSYFRRWEQLKLNFEKDTGRKKPADTFMGVFRKPSGLGDATKDLDAAIQRADEASLEKAEKQFESRRTGYIKVLEKSMNLEKQTEIKPELEKLKIGLNEIFRDFKVAKADVLGSTITKDLQPLFREIVTTIASLNAKLKELNGFVVVIGTTKSKLERSAKSKNEREFKLAVDNYKKAFEKFIQTAKSGVNQAARSTKRIEDSERPLSEFIKGKNANDEAKQSLNRLGEYKQVLNKTAKAIQDTVNAAKKGIREVETLQATLANEFKPGSQNRRPG